MSWVRPDWEILLQPSTHTPANVQFYDAFMVVVSLKLGRSVLYLEPGTCGVQIHYTIRSPPQYAVIKGVYLHLKKQFQKKKQNRSLFTHCLVFWAFCLFLFGGEVFTFDIRSHIKYPVSTEQNYQAQYLDYVNLDGDPEDAPICMNIYCST